MNRRRILTMTSTFLLITINQLVLFIAPDIIVLLLPQATGSLSFIFYVMNMNKGLLSKIKLSSPVPLLMCFLYFSGIVNILIFLLTQRELRRAIAKKLWIATKSQLQIITEKSTTKIRTMNTLTRDSKKGGMTRVY